MFKSLYDSSSGIVNACEEPHGNPSDDCWDFSVDVAKHGFLAASVADKSVTCGRQCSEDVGIHTCNSGALSVGEHTCRKHTFAIYPIAC